MAASDASEVATNEDLVEEIFSWLPAKSVIRLKSVCRMWRDIISTPHFISTHTRRNPHKPSGILFSVTSLDREPVTPAYSLCPIDGGVPEVFAKNLVLDGADLALVLQCSNGLLLSMGMEDEADYLYVHNPTTGQHRILPEIDLDPQSFGAVLAFDPSRSTNYHVLLQRFDYPDEIKVYDSATGASWKNFGSIGSPMSMSSSFFDGVVYWLDIDARLVKIDIEQELINETEIYPPMQDECFIMRLYESRGRLHLLRAKFHPIQAGILEVFELANDHSSWLLRHCVSVEDLPIHGLNLQSPDPVLELAWEDLMCNCVPIEAEQDDKLVVLIDNNLVAYSLRSKTHVVLCSYAPEKGVSLGFACANTLVAP